MKKLREKKNVEKLLKNMRFLLVLMVFIKLGKYIRIDLIDAFH